MSDQGEPRREKPSPYQAPKAEVLLRRAIEAVEAARPVPLSSDSRINKDELLELLNETLGRLPDELRAARWLLKEREEFLAKTRREGDEILELARVRAARMVERTEVVREAESRARQVLDDAEAEARRMRYEVEDYCDRKLGSFVIVLQRTLKSVNAGRAKLQGVGRPPLAEGRAHRGDPESPEDGAVFDQDLA
jgi:hypothetical protein